MSGAIPLLPLYTFIGWTLSFTFCLLPYKFSDNSYVLEKSEDRWKRILATYYRVGLLY